MTNALRHLAARILAPVASSSRASRPSFPHRRTFALYAGLTQGAITSNGYNQAIQQSPSDAADTAPKEQTAEKASKSRLVKSKSHYVNPLKPGVSIRTKNGRELTFNFDPTPKANVEKLRQAVKSLCSWPADHSQESKIYTVGQPHWSLTLTGDGVFRQLAVKSSKERDEITSRIQKVAGEMEHHPIIISMKPDRSGTPMHMCVISTTHQPRGLSMRDIRLALAIDTILRDYDVERPTSGTKHEQAVAIVRRSNNEMRKKINEAITDAVGRANATSDAAKGYPEHINIGAG